MNPQPKTLIAALCTAAFAGCSAQPAGPTAGGSGNVRILNRTAPMQYVRFTDPTENGFSAAVPQGWRVTGGTVRVSPIDARHTMQLTSPDGVFISYGNPSYPTFITPNYMLDSTGFREGSRYPNGYGGHMLVRRFMPGVMFAEEFVRQGATAGQCEGLTIVDRRDRPELAAALNQLMATIGMGVTMQLNTGDVAFTCTRNGQEMLGYYLAGTLMSQMQTGPGIWLVHTLQGFIAPAPKAGLGKMMLAKLVSSFRVNPQWAQMQGRITARSSQIMAESNEQVSKAINDSYWSRARVLDRVYRNDANARRGTTDLVDPNTGETWNVAGGYRHYWRKPGSDDIVGTNTYDPPGVGYHPVNEY